MDEHYRIEVFYSEPDACWVARVPDVPAIAADGPTPEDAVREVRIVLREALQVLRESGHPIPKPSAVTA